MNDATPETTGQLVSRVVDCLDVLAERFAGDTLSEIAVGQMRFYAGWLVDAVQDGETETAA